MTRLNIDTLIYVNANGQRLGTRKDEWSGEGYTYTSEGYERLVRGSGGAEMRVEESEVPDEARDALDRISDRVMTVAAISQDYLDIPAGKTVTRDGRVGTVLDLGEVLETTGRRVFLFPGEVYVQWHGPASEPSRESAASLTIAPSVVP